MGEKIKSTHTNPGGTQVEDSRNDDGVVNDSLGTSDPADSTGLEDDEKNKRTKNQPQNSQTTESRAPSISRLHREMGGMPSKPSGTVPAALA